MTVGSIFFVVLTIASDNKSSEKINQDIMLLSDHVTHRTNTESFTMFTLSTYIVQQDDKQYFVINPYNSVIGFTEKNMFAFSDF